VRAAPDQQTDQQIERQRLRIMHPDQQHQPGERRDRQP
jgi:hypothetical protein